MIQPNSARNVKLRRGEHWCIRNYDWVLCAGPDGKPVGERRALAVAEARLRQWGYDAVELKKTLRNLRLGSD
jgi:hypothetical protein